MTKYKEIEQKLLCAKAMYDIRMSLDNINSDNLTQKEWSSVCVFVSEAKKRIDSYVT